MKTPIVKKRNVSEARLLTYLLPGLGHLYCGEFSKAVILICTSILLPAAMIFGWAIDPIRSVLYLYLCLVIYFIGTIWAYIDVRKSALRAREDYRLKDYNRGWIYALIVSVFFFGVAPIVALTIKLHLSEPFSIPTNSVAPTVISGDKIIVSKTAYRTQSPERGDMIVFLDPQLSGRNFIQRIVAIGGDTIEIKDGILLINGQAEQPTYQTKQEKTLKDFPQLTLRASDLFTMGDNRDISHDSRVFGPISIFSVKGKVTYRYWPLNKTGEIK